MRSGIAIATGPAGLIEDLSVAGSESNSRSLEGLGAI